MNSNCWIMSIVAPLIVICGYQTSTAGTIAELDGFWWVTNHQLQEPNNDDYTGVFESSPNKVSLNSFHEPGGTRSRQRVDAIELIVPTIPSGGTTEYGLTLGGNQPESTPDSDLLLKLDNLYIVELGFGTGDRFIPASQVVGLQFDSSESVSPEVWSTNIIFIAELPVFSLVDHASDHLLLQGRYNLGNLSIGSFATDTLLTMPLDVPDLPASVLDHYTAEELAGLEPSHIPFTLRMHVVPEPAGFYMFLGSLTSFVLLAASRRRY